MEINGTKQSCPLAAWAHIGYLYVLIYVYNSEKETMVSMVYLSQIKKLAALKDLTKCTNNAFDAFNLASFFDFPDPSNEISLSEALMMKMGAWEGPDVDTSWKSRGLISYFRFKHINN